MQPNKSNLLFTLFVRAIHFVALNLTRIMILTAFHAFRLTIGLFEVLLSLAAKCAPLVGLSVVSMTDQNEEPFTDPKFSEDEIEQMALRLPSGVETIQAISEHFDVSMRQARKVKAYLEARLNVNCYTAVNRAA